MLSLWAVFVAGLVGSAHCAGMCGGFALALGALPGSDAYAGRLAAYLARTRASAARASRWAITPSSVLARKAAGALHPKPSPTRQ